MAQFLSIFFVGFLQFLLGFSTVPFFFVSSQVHHNGVVFKNGGKTLRITVFWNAKLCSVADFRSNMKEVGRYLPNPCCYPPLTRRHIPEDSMPNLQSPQSKSRLTRDLRLWEVTLKLAGLAKRPFLRSSQRYCWSPPECDAVLIDVFIFGVGLHDHEHDDTTIV